jgi:hypothetical protein
MAIKMKAGFSVGLLCLLCALVAGGRTDAQEKRPTLPAHFTAYVAAKYHQQSLQQIVTALDRQSGLNILIDGEPLAPMADVEVDGTLEEALNKIADVFDYNWKVGKGGIVLFNKRFRNRDDAPQASVVELMHLVNNMNAIFGLVHVDPEPGLWLTHLNQLGESLTETQRASLLTGKRMPAKDLRPEQLLHLRTAVLNNTFGDAMLSWADLAAHLRTFGASYLVATPDLQRDPEHPDVPLYTYQIFWHDPDGSLSSEFIHLRFFGNL